MKDGPLENFILSFVSPFCLCRKCPSYPDKGDPRVYCERGKSPHEISQNGCLCGSCFVHKINRFTGGYYCIGGKDSKSKI